MPGLSLAKKLIAENKRTRSTFLDLGKCSLKKIPDEIRDLHWLEGISLSSDWHVWDGENWTAGTSQNTGKDNQVTDLSPLASLTTLKELFLPDTQVSDLGPLAGLTALQTLHCNGTQVSDLTPLAGMTALQTIYCSRTLVSDLTPLARLTALQALYCPGTHVSDLTPLAGLTALQAVSCSNTSVNDLAPLARLTALQTIDCSNTSVNDLAPLARLTALQTLYCNMIQVSDLTPLAGLTALQAIDCSNTSVNDLAPLARLTALQTLYCYMTQVSDLTPLAGLTALKTINCNHTQVSDLAPLARLTALQELYCGGTQVNDLKSMIDHIRSGLQVKLAGRYWRGHGIYVEDCPLTNPPAQIVAQGNEAILNYFAEREKGPTDHLYEAKMLVLGEGGSGKTSLIRRLYHSELKELPKEDESTKGIVIERQDFPMRNGRTFRLNVWDFGGQQIYHATHQFFLTQRSLYILLDDTRNSDKSVSDKTFRYWLELIDAFSEHSPALIFQNEKSGRSKAIDFNGIKREYTNVRELYKGNLELQNSTDTVRRAIEHFAENLPHIGEELPASWVTIRAEIEELSTRKYVIPVEEYLALCAPHLDGDEKRALFLSSYLHDLGVFLHFQDDPILRKTVILKNEWATTAVFRILDDEIVKKALGRFSEADCARLWQGTDYGKNHLELLALMEKFELCYRLRDTWPSTWLAPQLLPPSKPEESKDWGKPGDVILRYKYEFLPGGMISRLIVRLHRYVINPEKAWATGVLFQEKCLAHRFNELLAEVLPSGDEIELRARGPEAKNLLSVVSADLEALNDSFKGLREKVGKRIPCHCKICGASPQPEFFEYKKLLQRKVDNKLQVECPRSYEDVSVLKLLEGTDSPDQPELRKVTHVAKRVLPIRIFLASSSELRKDRDDFELAFRQLNDELVKDGFHLEIVRWENFLDAVSTTRKQDDYNEKICACDVFVSLFFTKAGKFTNEEFEVAHRQFKGTGKPLIYTYIKDAPVSTGNWKKEDQDSIHTLKEKLSAIEHFPTTYTSIDNLIIQFRNQLAKIREKLWP